MSSITSGFACYTALLAIYEFQSLLSHAPASDAETYAAFSSALDDLHSHVTCAISAQDEKAAASPLWDQEPVTARRNNLQSSTLADLDVGVNRILCSMKNLSGEVNIVKAWHGLHASGISGLIGRQLPGNPKWSRYDVDRICDEFMKAKWVDVFASCEDLDPRAQEQESSVQTLLNHLEGTLFYVPEALGLSTIMSLQTGLTALRAGYPTPRSVLGSDGLDDLTNALLEWQGIRKGVQSEWTDTSQKGFHFVERQASFDQCLEQVIARCHALKSADDWVKETVRKPSSQLSSGM